MTKLREYEKLYRRNNETKRMMIDISLDDYLSFFHEVKDEKKESLIQQSYHNFYSSLLRLEERKSRQLFRLAILLFLISLVLLTIYGLVFDLHIDNIAGRVFRESLLIGGWVFTWEAVHQIFIGNIEPRRRLKEIKRFVGAELSFKYHS